jgi:uridine monophosphate synthetase
VSIEKNSLCVGLDFDASFEEYVEYISLIKADMYKINPAFFNRYALLDLANYFRVNNIKWIYDAKIGDVEHTNAAYAKYIYETLGAWGTTLNPYLGFAPLEAFFAYKSKVSFILCRTTNPGSEKFQKIFEEEILSFVSGRQNLGVVYASGEKLEVVSERLKDNLILCPGIGVQGGKILDAGDNIIFSVSRSIRSAKDPKRISDLYKYSLDNNFLLEKINSCINYGRFTLSSGIQSNYYVDLKSLTKDIDAFDFITDILANKIKADAVLGIESGSISYAAGAALKKKIQFGFIRKAAKEYGAENLVEGLTASKVAIIEDVLTTGKSLEKAIAHAESCGFEVVQVIVIVNRNPRYKSKYNIESLLNLS